MKIATRKKPHRYYCGIDFRFTTPAFSIYKWAGITWDTLEQAQVCAKQLELLGFDCVIVED